MSSNPDLRKIISSLTSALPHRSATRQFADICYQTALPYILEKRRTRRLNLTLLGLSAEDLAFDCIADLFERNDLGQFCLLQNYYTGVDWNAVTDQELWETTRRLVFSIVNENIFRNYRENDPSLSKLIRNLKRAIRLAPQVNMVRSNGTAWVTIGTPDRNLPVMPPEFLEIYLTRHVREELDTKQLLLATVAILNGQSLYRKAVPLSQLAHAIRAASVKVQDVLPVNPMTGFLPDEVTRMIETCIEAARNDISPRYVQQGKMTAETFESYLKAIRLQLLATYVRGDDHNLTNYKALSTVQPDLSRQTYGNEHRAIYEYVSRCVRERLFDLARAEHEVGFNSDTKRQCPDSVQEAVSANLRQSTPWQPPGNAGNR